MVCAQLHSQLGLLKVIFNTRAAFCPPTEMIGYLVAQIQLLLGIIHNHALYLSLSFSLPSLFLLPISLTQHFYLLLEFLCFLLAGVRNKLEHYVIHQICIILDFVELGGPSTLSLVVLSLQLWQLRFLGQLGEKDKKTMNLPLPFSQHIYNIYIYTQMLIS